MLGTQLHSQSRSQARSLIHVRSVSYTTLQQSYYALKSVEKKRLFIRLLNELVSAWFLKRGPRPPFVGHEQRPSLVSFAVILQNTSVMIC